MSRETMQAQFDDNVKRLLADIEAIVPVEYELHDKKCYQTIIKKDGGCGLPNKAIVYYYEPLNLAKLAHELYHLKIGLLLGDCSVMLDLPENNMEARMLFSKSFCSDFMNNSDHVVFYPLYKEAGYDDDSFFDDFNPESFEPYYTDMIENGIKNTKGEYITSRVGNLLGLLTLYMFFPLDNRFSNHKKKLKRIDTTLYGIYVRYLDGLKNIKIEPQYRENFQSLYLGFRDEMLAWIRTHKMLILQ